MELKEAMEAATENLDVRPGFVGDVMAGARRRHTRKLVTVTAVVALLAGMVAGVALTSSSSELTTNDVRLTAQPSGDLVGNNEFVDRSLRVWHDALTEPTLTRDGVTDVSADSRVFWTANTPGGPAALVVQPVRVRNSDHPQTLVGLVAGGTVVDREVAYAENGRERGIYQFGADDSTFVVLGLGKKVFWSVNPVRGADHRWSRAWKQAVTGPGDVAVLYAKPEEKPVFLRTDTPPAPDDFTRYEDRLISAKEMGLNKVVQPRGGLGWKEVMWASARQEPSMPGTAQDRSPTTNLLKQGYLDYGRGYGSYTDWEVRAWLPDGRYAAVFETNGELIGALYHPDGRFDRILLGGPAVKGAPVPVRIALPDNQGTILADRGALLGPDEREHAWLAPPGTTEVTVLRAGETKVVPLT